MAKINFISETEEALKDFPFPEPSVNFIPNWYKEMPNFIGNKKYIAENNNPNETLKKCVPFRDSMAAGYMIPLPFDLYVKQEGNNTVFNSSYMGEMQIVHEQDPEQYFMYPIPENYFSVLFKWDNPWLIQTSKGWSTLFVSPTHHDLPFYTLSGLVDTDKHPAKVALPFFLKKDFEGIIPKGTPIVQCIPIKRAKFAGKISYGINHFNEKWRRATTIAIDRYKRFFHAPKSYKLAKPKESKCPFSFLFKNKH
jgi:hypothetical protein